MKHFIIITFLLILAFVLRWHQYSTYPQRGATSDEYAFAFQGISLLTRGVPIAWSAIPLYKAVEHLTIDGLYFPIVRPYFDHPPLFGLLVGTWSILSEEPTFEAVRLGTIRMIPVILSTLSAFFLYLLAKKVYGPKIALWSLAIFATGTLFAVNSRIVVAESLLTLLSLLALFVVCVLPKKPPVWQLLLLGVICALAVLSKVLGVVVFFSVAAICFWRGLGIRRLMWIAVPFVLGLGVFYLYGRAYDEELFWAVQSYQGTSRVLGPNTIWMIIGSPGIVNKIVHDGWYIWGLLALGIASLDMRRNMMIVVPALLYLLLLVVSVNETDIHSWYLIPLFPFLAIAGGKLLVDSIENQRWTLLIWVILIGASLVGPLYEEPFGLTPGVYRGIIGTLVMIVSGIVLIRSSRLTRRIGYCLALLSILGTAIATLRYIHPS